MKNTTDFHGDFTNMTPEDQDKIINPHHYSMVPPEEFSKFPRGLEYFDLMVYVLAHHKPINAHGIGQALKYLLRAGKKDALVQDLKKAKWYLEYIINLEEDKPQVQPEELKIRNGLYPQDPQDTEACISCGCPCTTLWCDFCLNEE